jgi:hypothetical protein
MVIKTLGDARRQITVGAAGASVSAVSVEGFRFSLQHGHDH